MHGARVIKLVKILLQPRLCRLHWMATLLTARCIYINSIGDHKISQGRQKAKHISNFATVSKGRAIILVKLSVPPFKFWPNVSRSRTFIDALTFFGEGGSVQGPSWLIVTVLWLCRVPDPLYSNICSWPCYGWPLSLRPRFPRYSHCDAGNILCCPGQPRLMLPGDLAQASLRSRGLTAPESRDLGYPRSHCRHCYC